MTLLKEELLRANELVREFCQARTNDSARLEFHTRGNRVTLVESRPFFIDPSLIYSVNVAQFEFNPGLKVWVLYWYDRKNRRQPYPTGRNRDTIEKLLAEVAADPTGIFWD